MPQDEQSSRPPRSKSLSIEDADGEELLKDGYDDDSVVVASDGKGNSLTLIEEYYSHRKSTRLSPVELTISFTCAAASLAFATLLYLNTR